MAFLLIRSLAAQWNALCQVMLCRGLAPLKFAPNTTEVVLVHKLWKLNRSGFPL